MRILNLEGQNFLAIKEVNLDLNDIGLVLVQGVNKDSTAATSNGAGKSSILDAISWGLFGTTARGVSGDDVINSVAGKGCYVKLTLELAPGSVLTVYRGRKTKPAGLSLNLDGTDLTKGTDALTQVQLESLIGCNAEIFNAAIYAGQESMTDLPGMGDAGLKEIVEKSAGIERLVRAGEVIKTKISTIKHNIIATEGYMRTTANSIDTLERLKANEEKAIAEFEVEKASKIKLIEDWMKGAFVELSGSVAALGLKTPSEIVAHVDACGKALNEARVASNKRFDEFMVANLELTNAKNRTASIERDILVIENAMTKIKKAVDNFGELVGKPCEECGKPHTTEDFEKFKAKQLEQYNGLMADRANISNIDLVKAKKEEELCKVKADAAAKAKALSIGAVDTAESIYKTANAAKTEISRIIDSVKAAKVNIATIKASSKDDANLKAMEEELKEYSKRYAEKGAELKDLNEQLLAATIAAEALGRTGVRSSILDTVTPYLNERTANYLSILSDGEIDANWSTVTPTAKGELREKFSIAVNTTAASSFKQLSGGEKRKVRLATALALQDLVSSRASKPINFFVADEIDEALDEAGLERLMSVLYDKAKDKGTVLVISHNDLKNWIPNAITVTKEGKQSTVKGL